jgi:hypothetical protein
MDTTRPFLLACIFLVLAMPPAASAQPEREQARASLLGIDAFHLDVEVEKSGSLEGREALYVRALRDTVLHILGAAGLDVLPPKAAPRSDTEPRLLVHVNALDVGRGLVPFSLSIRFQQAASLVRAPSLTLQVGTWESELVGLASVNRLRLIPEAAADIAHEFTEDFNHVNL